MVKQDKHERAEQDQQAEAAAAEQAAAEQAAAAPAPEGDAESAAAPEGGAALQAELEAARQDAAEAKDQALRAVAEAQNARRRAEKDVEQARKFALERFAGELLVIVDNLERALDAADSEQEAVKPVLEGIQLTHRSFLDTLAKHKIEQVDPRGEPFDPQFHEAMAMVPNPEVEPNTVIDVMQKGYTLNGRLLRAAMVVVAKAAE